MGLWVGNYPDLRTQIEYLNFKLNRLDKTEEEKLQTIEEIKICEQQSKDFLSISNVLEGIERTIFLKRYVELKRPREIVEELNISCNYFKNKSNEIANKIKFAERLLDERDKQIE